MTIPEAWTLWHVLGAVLLVAAGSIVGSWAAGVAGVLLERTLLDPTVRRLVTKGVRPLVIFVAIIAALDLLAIDLTAVAVLLGAATLAVGLALQPTLSHVASGAVLLTLRPYREGDLVTCAGLEGRVLEQGSLAVVLERPDGTLATVPNAVVFSGPILNHVRQGRRRVDLTVAVPADADLLALRTEVAALLAREPRVLPTPEPVVWVTADTTGPRLTATGWVVPTDHANVASDLAVELHGLVRVHVAERSR